MARDVLSRQSHRYMLKQLIELNGKKWPILSLVFFAKGFLLLIYDSRSREIIHSFVKAIDIETNGKKCAMRVLL